MNTFAPIITVPIFEAKTVGAGTSETSRVVQLQNAQANGFFSIQLTMTGDGSLALVYEVTVDGTNWLTPTGATSLETAFLKTSGPGGDGKDIVAFAPELATAIRFKATAAGDSLVLTATLAFQ